MGQKTETRRSGGKTPATRRADQLARRVARRFLDGQISEDEARREILGLIWRTDVPVSIAKQANKSTPAGCGDSLFEEVRDHAEDVVTLKALAKHPDGTPYTGSSVLDLEMVASGTSACAWARDLGVACVRREVKRKTRVISRTDLIPTLPEVDSSEVTESKLCQFTLRSDNVEEQALHPELAKIALAQNDSRKAHVRDTLRSVARSARCAYEVPLPGPTFADEAEEFVESVARSVADRKVHVSVRAVDEAFVQSLIGMADSAPQEIVDSVLDDLREPSPPPSQAVRERVARQVRQEHSLTASAALELVTKLCLALATADRVPGGLVKITSKKDMAARRRAFEKVAATTFPDRDPGSVARMVCEVLHTIDRSTVEKQVQENVAAGRLAIA